MRQYKKKYTGSEKTTRQQIFNRNYAEIVRQNAKGANLVVNKFIDWTDA
jgi:Tfp pilus assembly major pilin PilA